MLQRSTTVNPPPLPTRPLRVLIEDPALVADDLATPTAAIDVTACSGPCDERELCPLVMDGRCPLGPCDIVVSALTGRGRQPARGLGRDVHAGGRRRRPHRHRSGGTAAAPHRRCDQAPLADVQRDRVARCAAEGVTADLAAPGFGGRRRRETGPCPPRTGAAGAAPRALRAGITGWSEANRTRPRPRDESMNRTSAGSMYVAR